MTQKDNAHQSGIWIDGKWFEHDIVRQALRQLDSILAWWHSEPSNTERREPNFVTESRCIKARIDEEKNHDTTKDS